jgi:anti-anti-sigma factor
MGESDNCSQDTYPNGVRTVVGELDAFSGAFLFDQLRHKPGPLVLDLSGITFIDCSGLQALVRLHERRGARLVATSPVVERLLTLTELNDFFSGRGEGTVASLQSHRLRRVFVGASRRSRHSSADHSRPVVVHDA